MRFLLKTGCALFLSFCILSWHKPFVVLQTLNPIVNNHDSSILPKADPSQAAGTWIIDLRPDPSSQPYLKEFTIDSIKANRFNGEFYGYPFEGGFLNSSWEKIYFAFTTRDQSGTYYHAGSISGNNIEGITLNENREFVLPWKGTRKK